MRCEMKLSSYFLLSFLLVGLLVPIFTACRRSCSVRPWIVDFDVSEEEIEQWVNEAGEFIGSCELACREAPQDESTDSCRTLLLYDLDRNVSYPLERGGGGAGRLPGMGGSPGQGTGTAGSAGDSQWDFWTVRLECGSGEREYCTIEE